MADLGSVGLVDVAKGAAMTDHEIMNDIRERLIRMEERGIARDARLDRVDTRMGQIEAITERFRWWILGGITAAGTVGGVASDTIQNALK